MVAFYPTARLWLFLCSCLSFTTLPSVHSWAQTTGDKPTAPAAQKTSDVDAKGAQTAPVKARTKKGSGTTGLVNITTDKPGYRIFIDGKLVGVTPLPGVWTLPVGKHVVRAQDPAGKTDLVDVLVVAGKKQELVWPRAPVGGTGLKVKKKPMRWAAWSIADVGVATTVSGVVAIGLGALLGQRSLALATEASDMNIRTNFRRDFERLSGQAEDMALGANISFGIGAVAIIGGLTLAIFGDGGVVALSADDDEATVIIGGRF